MLKHAISHAEKKRQPFRILLIDSDLNVLATLKILLESHGHEVFIATDSNAALLLAQMHAPQVVFSGIELEETSGYEFAKQLRLLPSASRFRMIALAELNSAEAAEKRSVAGFDDFLLKPANDSEILSMLNHVVNE